MTPLKESLGKANFGLHELNASPVEMSAVVS